MWGPCKHLVPKRKGADTRATALEWTQRRDPNLDQLPLRLSEWCDSASQPSAAPREAGARGFLGRDSAMASTFCSPRAPQPGTRPHHPGYLVPFLLQLDHLALQGAHLLLVDLAVHLSFLELEQGMLLLFPVLDRGGQTEPMKVGG